MKITLCGSTRFKKEFQIAEAQLSLNGHAVYSCALWGHADDPLTDEDKLVLDAVHMVKIENSDAILVLNVGGYIGESTRREVFFAHGLGKKVFFVDPTDKSAIALSDPLDFRSVFRPAPKVG